MAKEIKQRIVLEGEQEYNRAINEAKRNLRTLRSELKAETAELGANATAQQKNEVKVKSLKAQIAEQEKVVKTYREALEEVREKYADNADEIAKYEQKLNDARTALANMKNQVDVMGNSFQTITNGAKQSAVENAALALSFDKISEAAQGMSAKLESIFKGVAGTISGTIGAIWGDLMEIAAKADNYSDLAAYLGSSTTEVQKWDRAMRAASGDMSTVVSLISRLKYGGKADKVTEWFGISAENYDNDLLYAEAVLGRMFELKDEMKAAGTWDDAMSEILGARKVQEVDGILSDWEEIQRNLKEFDVENGGVGLTEDELKTMNELNSQVNLLQEKWNAFKQSVETKIFGGIALDVTSNFQGALDALIDFMDADTQEEKDEAIQRFTDNITEAFTKIGEAVEAAGEALDQAGSALQGSENGYVRLLGNILSTVSGVMEWLGDEKNLETAKHVVEGLFALWGTAKAVEFIGKMKSLSGYFSNIFSNRKIPTLDGGTGLGNGNGTGTGSQNVTNENVTTENVTTQQVTTQQVTSATATNMSVPNETVTTSNVATMYVQNMVGGNPTTNPTNPTTPTAPALPSGSGTGLNGYSPILPPSGSATGLNSASQPVLPSGGSTPALPAAGESSPEVIDMGDGTQVILNGGGGTTVPDITIGADTVMFGSDIGLAGGVVTGMVMRPIEAGWERDAYLADLLKKYQLDMNDPDVKKAVVAAVYGYDPDDQSTWDKFLKISAMDGTVTLPGDLDEKFATIAEKYGTNPNGHFSMSPNPTLDEAVDAVSDWWTESMRLWKIANDAVEDEHAAADEMQDGIGSHAPDEGPDDYGYFDDSWSIDEIMQYYENQGGSAGHRAGLPASWWSNPGGTSTPDENGISGGDLENFRGLPAQLQAAAKKGVSDGVSGLRVEIDGQTAGRILAPYVSQEIAKDMG